jgi:hypothetical protein
MNDPKQATPNHDSHPSQGSLAAASAPDNRDEIEAQLMRIQQAIQHKKNMILGWTWITVAFWFVALCSPDFRIGIVSFFTSGILAHFAIISTLILLLWFPLHLVHVRVLGRTETSLRLKISEEHLRQMERPSTVQKED